MSGLAALVGLLAVGARPFVIGPPPPWVEPVVVDVHAPPPAGEVRDGVYYLLSDQQTRVGRTREAYGHFAKLIVNEAGLESSSQVSILLDPSYEALSLHFIRLRRGGAVLERLEAAKLRVIEREPELESQIYDGRLSVVLFVEDLRVGDVVEYAYTLRGENPVFEGRYEASFDVEWNIPLHRMRWRLLWPRGRSLFVRAHGTSITPTVRDRPDGKEYLWESVDVPAIPGDAQTPGWYDQWGWVQLSEWGSWEDVARWGERLFIPPAALPPELAARVGPWRGERDPARAVLAALRFVQDEVRYLGIEMGPGSHRPTAPDVVFRRRFGDCKDKTLLFCSLARALGIAAYPALVSTRLGRALDDWLPTPLAFNHAVARVEVGGRVHWVDPTLTAQGGPLDRLAFPGYERALVLRPGTARLSRTPARRPLTATRVVRDRIVLKDPGGPADFTVETRYEDAEADSMRMEVQHRSREETGRSYLDYYSRYYPSIRSAGPLVVEDDREHNVVLTREHYTIPELFTPVEGAKDRREAEFRPLALYDLLKRPPPRRSAPLEVTHPVFVRHTIEVALPAEWPAEPESATLSDEALRFVYRCRYEGRRLSLEYEYRSLANSVPAGRLARHLKTLDDVWTWIGYRIEYPPRKEGTGTRAGPDWSLLVAGGLMAALSLLGTIAAYQAWRVPAPAAPSPLRTLGAGLFLLVAALVFTTGLVVVRAVAAWPAYVGPAWAERTLAGARLYHPAWAPVRLAELGSHAVFVSGVGLLWLLLWRRRRRFTRAYVGLSLALAVFLFADAVALALLPGADAASLRPAVRDALLGLSPLFTAVPYLLASPRARRTLAA